MTPDESIRSELDAYRAETQAFRAEGAAFRAEIAAYRAEARAMFERLDARMDAQDRDIRTLIEHVMAINDRLDRLDGDGGDAE